MLEYQKMIKGFKSKNRINETGVEPATVNLSDRYRLGLDVNATFSYYTVGAGTIVSATRTVLNLGAHSFHVGDYIKFTTGSLIHDFASIIEVSADTVTLGQELFSAPAPGDAYIIYRAGIIAVDNVGRLYVRNTEYGPTGLSNFYWNIAGTFEVPTTVIGDPILGTAMGVDSVGGVGRVGVHGVVAHDAVAAGNPLRVGAKASSSVPAAVASGDLADIYVDTTGHQHVKVDDLPACDVVTSSIGGTGTLFQISVTGDRHISIHFTGTWTATVTFQVSNDGTNWINYTMESIAAPTSARTATNTSTNTIWNGPIPTGFFRAQVTAYTSGTISARYCLMEIPPNINSVQVAGTATISGTVTASNTAGNVAHDGADSGNPVKVGTKSRTGHVTAVANNDRSDWTSNVLGFGGVTLFHQNQSTTFTTAAPTYGATLGDGFQWWKGGSLLVVATGAVTSWTVELQVSLNNANWTTILTHTNLAPTNGVIQFPADAIDRRFTYARVGCTALVLGAGTNVIATVLLTQ